MSARDTRSATVGGLQIAISWLRSGSLDWIETSCAALPAWIGEPSIIARQRASKVLTAAAPCSVDGRGTRACRARGMTTARIDESALPPYTPLREPCRQCGRRDLRIMMIFDRECGAVIGAHIHRECRACGARWLEKCAPP